MLHEFNFPLVLVPLFFLVALIYSSVGHGGASGYLATFALFGISDPRIAPVALILNIIVAGVSFAVYRQHGYFKPNLLLPFAVSSVPLAFLGGYVHSSAKVFSVILGVALLLASLRIFFLGTLKSREWFKNPRHLVIFGLFLGGLLGFFSGVVGIGGGIFLSPVLILLGLASVKETAALSAVFIVLNSLSGFSGHILRGNVYWDAIFVFGGVVLVGGIIGSYFGAKRVPPRALQIPLGLILLLGSLRLFLSAFK